MRKVFEYFGILLWFLKVVLVFSGDIILSKTLAEVFGDCRIAGWDVGGRHDRGGALSSLSVYPGPEHLVGQNELSIPCRVNI